MLRSCAAVGLALTMFFGVAVAEDRATPAKRYFAHEVVEDPYGVIAPWYRGQNGQCDLRVRVAAETLKRYPWTAAGLAASPAPHFVFNGMWAIDPQGKIAITPASLSDWAMGDVGQQSASLLFGTADYYRYTGDPAAFGIVAMTADYVVDYCQTPADHKWPLFFISAPTKGKPYGRANPHGFIQLDLSAQTGTGLVIAYQLTGNARYWEAAKHWADLLAEHCDRRPGASPWGRYANPEDAPWKDNTQTTGVSLVLQFLDAVIRAGYTGKDGALLAARDAGERYLREVLLPEWSRDVTFGRHFWDWDNPVATASLPCYTAEYLMDHRDRFPNWKNDVRNMTSLFFTRSNVDPKSFGGVHSGAWAFPESSGCCEDSLQYSIMPFAAALGRYGALARSDWASEIARRQALLMTYDALENGVVIDGIRGRIVTAGSWFNLAHPWPLRCTMKILAWQPQLAANRENHILRTDSVVQDVRYGKDAVRYRTFDAPAGGEDVLRLAFRPRSASADGVALSQREKLTENGYVVQPLSNGDCLVTIRHDGRRNITLAGDDPQETADADRLHYEGDWTVQESPEAAGGKLRVADKAGAAASFEFVGNQVRLIGRADANGGRADVYLDGVKQLCGIDFWSPVARDGQVLCYKNGLAQGKHALKIVVLGEKNPRSKGALAYVEGVEWSAAQGAADFVACGPSDAQRVIFGYMGQKDFVDSQGRSWRPATEFVLRLQAMADLVPIALWTQPKLKEVVGTSDPELYRHGVHGRDFTAYFTVNPRHTYSATIKLCQAKPSTDAKKSAVSIDLQGKTVAEDLDIAAKAGGLGKAFDLVFKDIQPTNGVIAVRFWNRHGGEATCQAIEIAPSVAGRR